MNEEILKNTIENHFVELLNTHMANSPMLNHALRVEAVGFSKWNNRHLCVVITPWFMSLYLVPEEYSEQTSSTLKNGTIRSHSFTNGSYSFTAATDKLIGYYETCTLFTSMANFSSQGQARDVALETIRLLLNEKNTHNSDSTTKSNRRDLFRSALRRSKNA